MTKKLIAKPSSGSAPACDDHVVEAAVRAGHLAVMSASGSARSVIAIATTASVNVTRRSALRPRSSSTRTSMADAGRQPAARIFSRVLMFRVVTAPDRCQRPNRFPNGLSSVRPFGHVPVDDALARTHPLLRGVDLTGHVDEVGERLVHVREHDVGVPVVRARERVLLDRGPDHGQC